MTGVAIVGCGWAGARHAGAFTAHGAEVLWAVDPNDARARALRAANTTPLIEVALADERVGGVSVCVPHAQHLSVCTAAIEAGKDVLCEKPLAVTLSDADSLQALADNRQLLLMVAENEVYDPLYHAVRDVLASGEIGEPALLQATRECYLRDSFVQERPWFLRRDEAGGGMLLAGGVHDFAKLRLVLGEIVSVHARTAPQRFDEMEGEDSVVLLLQFASGAVGTLVESFLMIGPETIRGDEVHRLRVDGRRGSVEVLDPSTIRVATAAGVREFDVMQSDTFDAEVREFLDCIEHRREPLTSARNQRRNLELVEAAYRSIATGETVEL